jgi:SAM-dependent methyltransferase
VFVEHHRHAQGFMEMPTQRVTSAEKLPWPGEELVARVTGGLDRKNFYNSGRQSVRDIEAALGLLGRSFDSFETILDFGSGCGRIMLWLEHLAQTSALHGVDIDARAIAWARENMPWATFKVNQPLPPLDYPDGCFDLVFNHSVFTHIDEHYQDQWLAELRRVVRPGGYLLLTVHGEHAFLVFEDTIGKTGGDTRVIREELQRKGISFIRDDAFVGGPFPEFYHSTFHAPWYVFEHWGGFFDIAAYLVRGSMGFQDFVLLQRPPDDQPGGKPRPSRITAVTASALTGPASPPAASTNGDQPSAAETALERAGRLLHQGFDPDGGGDPSIQARLSRRLVEPAVRGHADYQREVNAALFTALWELEATVTAKTTHGGVPLGELNARLWDAVRLQGQRINRLEADLWDALQAREAGGEAPGSPPP